MIDENSLLATIEDLKQAWEEEGQEGKTEVVGILSFLERFIKLKAKNGGWIAVSERLPDNAKNENAFCPRYQITTRWGITDGWYNPGSKGWYVLIWFMTGRLLESDIDLKRGDIPKVLHIPDESNIVTAWKPLPEPLKGEQE